jgi:hypothetical protein
VASNAVFPEDFREVAVSGAERNGGDRAADFFRNSASFG